MRPREQPCQCLDRNRNGGQKQCASPKESEATVLQCCLGFHPRPTDSQERANACRNQDYAYCSRTMSRARTRRGALIVCPSPFEPAPGRKDHEDDPFDMCSISYCSSWYGRSKQVNFSKDSASTTETRLSIDLTSSQTRRERSIITSPTRKRLLMTARGRNMTMTRKKITQKSFNNGRSFHSDSSKRLLRMASRLRASDMFKVERRSDAKYFGTKGRSEFFDFYRALSAERNHYTKEEQDEWVQYVFPEDAAGGGGPAVDVDSETDSEDEEPEEAVHVIHHLASLDRDSLKDEGSCGSDSGGSQNPSIYSRRLLSFHPSSIQLGSSEPSNTIGAIEAQPSFTGLSLDQESLTQATGLEGGSSAAENFSDDDSAAEGSHFQPLPPTTHESEGLDALYEELFGAKRAAVLLSAGAQAGPSNKLQPQVLSGIITPRGWYAFACAQGDMFPTPGNLIRKNVVQTLNLAHKGIGDAKMLAIAKSLRRLPNVQALDLSDNRLTDASLQEVMRSVEHMRELRSLNLGFNRVNNLSAEMLKAYLSSSRATITELNLSSADVDDEECAHFMKAIEHNARLTNLNLSHNLIGSMETRNVLQPQFLTGGEAIGLQLEKPTCRLKLLDLSWNGLRQGSARALGSALGVNTSLIELNLEYNALGQEGGLAVAHALFENRSLRRLNVKNNALTPMVAYCLLSGVLYHKRLQYLDLSGNNLGYEGGRALMGLVLDTVGRLDIDFEACSYELVDHCMWFNAHAPGGSFSLDMSQTYDRCVLVEMLYLVAHREGITFKTLSHKPTADAPGVEVGPKRVVRATEEMERGPFDEDELQEEFASHLVYGRGERLFAHELQEALASLGLDSFSLEDVKNFIHYYDRGYAGGVTCDEFSLLAHYLYRICTDLQPKERFVAQGTSAEPWQMPLTGVVNVTLEYRPRVPLEGCYTSMAQVEALIEAAGVVGDSYKALDLAADYLLLQLEEASALLESLCLDGRNRASALAAVLPRVFVPQTAHLLADRHIKGFGADKAALIHAMGLLYYPVFGCPMRRYLLDLSRRHDRQVLERLYYMQNRDNVLRTTRRPLRPDTSFRANGSNFRNETIDGKAGLVLLDHAFFLHVPMTGLLQFDYVVHLQPEASRRWMSDARFLKYMCQIRLLPPWEVPKAKEQLKLENRPRELYDFFQHDPQSASRVGVQLSQLYHDAFPNQDDDKYRKMEVLNSIYELGNVKAKGPARRRVELHNDILQSLSVRGARGTVTKLRQWAKRARTRVHRQEIRHELLSLLANRLLTVNQALLILAFYPEEELETQGHDDLSGRLRLAIMLYPSLLDLFDFDKLLFLFTPEQQGEFIHRVGRLNMLNMLRCDGGIQLCLERREDRQGCKLLMHLALDEPGECMTQETWRYSRLEPCIPGWQMTSNWVTEQGFGSRGFITFFFYSGDGRNLRGCVPNYTLRCALSLLTNVDVPEALVRVLVPATQGMTRLEMDKYLLDYLKSNLLKNGIRFEHHFAPPPL